MTTTEGSKIPNDIKQLIYRCSWNSLNRKNNNDYRTKDITRFNWRELEKINPKNDYDYPYHDNYWICSYYKIEAQIPKNYFNGLPFPIPENYFDKRQTSLQNIKNK